MSKKNLRYRIGIDVGLYSVGLCAIEIDDSSDDPRDAMPLRLLSCMSVIHDAGVDPDNAKQADSRKAISGEARRKRRMRKREHLRLEELDQCLVDLGYPIQQAIAIAEGSSSLGNKFETGYASWNARIYAANQCIANEHERKLAIAVALRHIARHRGWRNPYSDISSLIEQSQTASPFYKEAFARLQAWKRETGRTLDRGAVAVQKEDKKGNTYWDIEAPEELWSSYDRPTPAELVQPFLDPALAVRFRHDPPEGYSGLITQMGKLHQSDYYYEIARIFETQQVPEEDQRKLYERVFYQVNPRDVGAAARLVARDDLPGQGKYPRATKASLAFQQYRILTTITNLRIEEGYRHQRPLSVEEIQSVYAFLCEKGSADTTWHDVSDVLGIERNQLQGVGGQTQDGEPISAKMPPVLNTEIDLLKKKEEYPAVANWWNTANDIEKEMLIDLLGNAGVDESLDDEQAHAMSEAGECLNSLSAEELTAINKVKLSSGRAAYSINSLQRLNKRMLEMGEDLFTARKNEFNVDNDWHPKPVALGTPIGNPAADRTIRVVSRWLQACCNRWGKPETVNIEHVREGFKSPKYLYEERQKKERKQKNSNSQYNANLKTRETIVSILNDSNEHFDRGPSAIRHADIRRQQAIQRQHGRCAYCDSEINFFTAQMDHIVPRKGPGCSNDMSNLIAVCAACNKSKRNTLFYTWAKTNEKRKEVLDRVDAWDRDSYFSTKAFKTYIKDVKARLNQKEADEPIDNRSMESVAWMARELRQQIEGYLGYEEATVRSTEGNDDFALSRVNVFRGSVVAVARKASGLERRLPWIGGFTGKTRLDRRHHAVDAAVIAMMRPAVGKVLAEREALRREAIESNISQAESVEQYGRQSWKAYEGDPESSEFYRLWRDCQMQRLTQLLETAMNSNAIVVTSPVRLSLSNGGAHGETALPLYKVKVGQALTPINIDKAESPALWMALVSHPDFDSETGLPEDWNRHIRVNGKLLDAYDDIGFFVSEPSKGTSEDAWQRDFDMLKDAVYAPVRGGFAAIGNSIHHARFYRIPKVNKKGKQTGWQYAMLRVFQVDLVKHHGEDLFHVDIPPQSFSRRAANEKLRKALDEGTAEYLGWAVVGDELQINPDSDFFAPSINGNAINRFMQAFPGVSRFKVTGFSTRDKIRLEPAMFSSEGIPAKIEAGSPDAIRLYGDYGWSDKDIASINTVLGIHGSFYPVVDKLFLTTPVFIRRNVLGEVRWKSVNHMPVSWRVTPHPDVD